ncbi:MAG: endolytic transglycosylase MltG [Proteobacteria bacterium]|nr:endolytic transglycosylase MltG [Pseudomonadota bacterium]
MASVALFVFLLIFGIFAYGYMPGPLSEQKQVIIKKGAGVHGTAEALKAAGVISSERLFQTTHVLFFLRDPLRAGEYEFKPGMSLREVFKKLISGDIYYRKLTVAEGLTSFQIAELLMATEGLEGEVPAIKEGTLLPETYLFAYGESRATLVKRMQKAQEFLLSQIWAGRNMVTPIDNQKQAIILASIVEKETSLESERKHVASVFINRLGKDMKLQSDPTVIYALTQGRGPLSRPLLKKDLEVKSPYNTYVVSKLPPGPICNPGKASIAAVLNPDSTNDLYFVADGTGGHAFAPSLKEHNENVKSWRDIKREQKKAASKDAPAAAAKAETKTTPVKAAAKNTASESARKAPTKKAKATAKAKQKPAAKTASEKDTH